MDAGQSGVWDSASGRAAPGPLFRPRSGRSICGRCQSAFARGAADRVIFLDRGGIVEQGEARQVIEAPREERTRRFLSRYAGR